jgi:hypothetical protein
MPSPTNYQRGAADVTARREGPERQDAQRHRPGDERATWSTEFNENTKVKKVIRESLDHFIAEGAMADGDYRLSLIVGGQAQPPLPEDAKLQDAAVADGALLALVPRDPQVDG